LILIEYSFEYTRSGMIAKRVSSFFWHEHVLVVSRAAVVVFCLISSVRGFSASITSSYSKNPSPNIVAVTHAAGRMGKTLALQIREDAQLNGVPLDDLPQIRAIVRSEAEALSVKCDLGGIRLVEGEVVPIPLDWLETIVVEDVSCEEGKKTLQEAFDGAVAAILCDASHNEMVWQEQQKEEDDGDDAVRVNENASEMCSISVPAAESKDLSKRLLAEIESASSSTSLRHVVMRSSMGLSMDISSEAAQAMGGKAALEGPRRAEEALRSTTLDYTILRLGVLTDDAGMVPLIFGTDDSILEKRMDSSNTRRPPILSRSDAARVSTFLLREASSFKGLTIDCSWHPKYGRSSVGSEEAINAAGRQDLKQSIINEFKLQAT